MKTNMRKQLNPILVLGVLASVCWPLCGGAVAQTACSGPTGPDVIVGDIQGTANYTSAGGIEALALGTYSCNVGQTWLNWFANTNQHPVIGGNLYKYRVVAGSGRIEQLGMSWLKHGFYALSNALCCTSCQATDGTHLGVRCSDPYTASRNGTQSGAGPRWQVNAATGVFAFPPANPSWNGTAARRLQVKVGDLEPSSASVRYFGEAQYVTQDDAAAGNQDNNASYRELAVTGSGSDWDFNLLPGSSTQREQPAILAWIAIDPAVRARMIDIAGDGRVILAYRTTDLGAGQWHYEYALFNLNSDLSIQAFTLPTGTATLSNIEFHDVDYHDGDGIGNVTTDGSDWSVSQSGGSITWSTSSFAANPNANALRWGTMYNFRFDANVAPGVNPVVLSTFKSAGSVLTLADTPAPPAPGGAIASICDPGAGGVMACPCANPPSGAGRGCENSSATGGASLSATGNASLASDSVQFVTSGEKPTATSIVLQGAGMLPSGVAFGQGVRCVNGALKRIYAKVAVAGSISVPGPTDPPLSQRSAALGDPIPSGSHRYYSVYYRDPVVLGGCSASNTFNTTQAVDITWNP